MFSFFPFFNFMEVCTSESVDYDSVCVVFFFSFLTSWRFAGLNLWTLSVGHRSEKLTGQ